MSREYKQQQQQQKKRRSPKLSRIEVCYQMFAYKKKPTTSQKKQLYTPTISKNCKVINVILCTLGPFGIYWIKNSGNARAEKKYWIIGFWATQISARARSHGTKAFVYFVNRKETHFISFIRFFFYHRPQNSARTVRIQYRYALRAYYIVYYFFLFSVLFLRIITKCVYFKQKQTLGQATAAWLQ